MQTLELTLNKIADAGLTALAKAVESGALASLETLNLGVNKIGNDGMKALADACASGALPQLKDLWILKNAPALKAACEARGIAFH